MRDIHHRIDSLKKENERQYGSLIERLHVLDLARMVGHRDLKQLQTYYNPRPEELAEKLG